jgi:hypothetical protein
LRGVPAFPREFVVGMARRFDKAQGELLPVASSSHIARDSVLSMLQAYKGSDDKSPDASAVLKRYPCSWTF